MKSVFDQEIISVISTVKQNMLRPGMHVQALTFSVDVTLLFSYLNNKIKLLIIF